MLELLEEAKVLHIHVAKIGSQALSLVSKGNTQAAKQRESWRFQAGESSEANMAKDCICVTVFVCHQSHINSVNQAYISNKSVIYRIKTLAIVYIKCRQNKYH